MKTASLTFSRGMGNVPSDNACEDTYCELSEGMIYEDGEYKPILHPSSTNDYTGIRLLFVHDYGGYSNYIGIKSSGGTKLVWKNGNTYEEIATLDGGIDVVEDRISITAIGNTLVVKNVGVSYYLFKEGHYVNIGSLPKIDATVSLESVSTSTEKKAIVKYYVENTYNDSPDTLKIIEEHRKELNDALTGHVLEVLNDNKKDGYFHFAFFVRLAYRMYDGSHTMMTNPILMYSTIDRNECLLGLDYSTSIVRLESMRYYPKANRLKVDIQTDLSDYSDIIDGIDVFVSDEIEPYDFNEDWEIDGIFPYGTGDVESMQTYSNQTISDDPSDSADIHGTFVGNCFVSEYGFKMWKWAEVLRNGINGTYQEQTIGYCRSQYSSDCTLANTLNRAIPKRLSEKQLLKKLSESSQFYKIMELGREQRAYYADQEMESNTLLTLTTRPMLEHDDYYNHCEISAETMFAYNGRLHLGNVRRGFFKGYETFMPSQITSDRIDGADYTSYLGYVVEIATESGKRFIENPYTHTELIGYYFYYPDPRAVRVYFELSNGDYVGYDLKPHPYLNGAYFLDTPPRSNHSSGGTIYQGPLPIDATPETLRSQLMVSEVNNPYYFNVDGYEEVGSGKILGMSSNTEALSEGQFGDYPLYVFTSEGIWALGVNNDGTYGTVKPLSREVCNNPRSITQTDNAVFFTSEKGLMSLYGKTVKCVSNAMMGKEHTGVHSFRNCLLASKIAYDYRNSRLWLIDESEYSYVYSLKEGTFAVYVWPEDAAVRVVNFYPDNLIQGSTGKVYSLLGTPDMNDDANVYDCRLITRPLKLGGVYKHKKIHMWDHITAGVVETELYACDKMDYWAHVLKNGRYWRFHRLVLTLRLTATQAWSGLILMYDVHREHRLFNNDRD